MELHLPHLPAKSTSGGKKIPVTLLVAMVSLILTGWVGWMLAHLWIDGPISDAAISAHLLKLSTADIDAFQKTATTYHHPAEVPTLKQDPLIAPSTTP